ncbi:type II secretion system protein GspM [Thiocystis violacea]|uniref:type II secretion system protein GspM n=1 Tax=Thiocystis violacea TaxID=13725 RepID=UPI00190763EB|nr:type II secretion system protein GspM [Thiocystis violacea]MBK1717423.1 general secretion pathway protein GspM [Thiocystis violacea]
MTTNPPSRLLCLSVLAAVFVLPLLLLAAVAIPWATRVSELNETIATHEDQLRRYRRLVQSLPTLQAELEQARTNNAFEAFYFKAPTQALAGAQLQGLVQEIVSGSAGRLISTQILPEEKKDDPPLVRVRTQIQGSTETLLEVLYRLEQARPFLFVERLSIRSSARPTMPEDNVGRARRRVIANQGGELTVRLDIHGFVLGGGS